MFSTFFLSPGPPLPTPGMVMLTLSRSLLSCSLMWARNLTCSLGPTQLRFEFIKTIVWVEQIIKRLDSAHPTYV